MSADGLSVIHESSPPSPPPIPEKSARRSQYLARRFLGDPPRHNHEKSPPPYSDLAGVIGPKGVKSSEVRNGVGKGGRGGWIRLVLFTLFVVLAIVGLIVGLVVGMKGKNSSSPSSTDVSASTLGASPAISTSSSAGATPTPLPNAPFPAGSYTLRTFLSTVLTNCTSNPATWRCYPYSTYADSPASSAATFNWEIAAWPGPAYTISSTQNPFAFSFANISLKLLDAGKPSERYYFSTTMQKLVLPSAALTADNSATQCTYNDTTLHASLYTQMASNYPPASASGAPGATFQTWPHAVSVEQVVGGGVDTPACYKTVDGKQGARLLEGITPQPAGELCSCLYINYGVPS
ncbi:MAG: hypothetical protein M1829_002731 [Trizodia sp. TS-e1964]|nr:MAG: hypothetical protein M1829_002731 [Trizodia sp. TS-e1964]